MARLSKPSSLRTDRKISKEELQKRMEIEQQLMGSSDDIKSIPDYLNDYEKIYYKWLVNEVEISGLITNIDKPLLEQVANCLFIMKECDNHINDNGILIFLLRTDYIIILYYKKECSLLRECLFPTPLRDSR